MTLRNGNMEFSETKPYEADIQLSLSSPVLASILTATLEGAKAG